MSLGRKTFLSASLLAAAAVLTSCKNNGSAQAGYAEYFPVLEPKDYDYAGMMATLRNPNPHKQVFSTSSILVQPGANYAAIYAHMQFAMNGYDLSIGPGSGKLATLAVFSGASVALALNDDMWQTYRIGDRYGIAKTNIYYKAKSDLDVHSTPSNPHGLYQDLSGQAVLARGGSFMVCHNALANFAAGAAARLSKAPNNVLEEMLHNLLPGFKIVPAGVTAVQLAQEHGWKLYTVA